MNLLNKQFRRLWHLRRLALYLYLLKLTISVLMIIPVFVIVNASLAPSDLSYSLLLEWDFSSIVELIIDRGETILPLLMSLIIGAIIYMIIMQFLNGGIYFLSVSGLGKDIDWREFFAECGANFGIHIRITLLMAIIYSLLLPASIFLSNIIGVIGGSLVGTAALLLIAVKLSIVFFVLLAASTFSDSARSAAAAHPEKSIRDLLKTTADFFRPRPLKLVGFFMATYLPFLIIWMIVEFMAIQVTHLEIGIIGVIFEFLIFQVSSIARTVQKLWYLLIVGTIYRQVNPGRFISQQTELPFDG